MIRISTKLTIFRYKWQKLKESDGVEKGIKYTGAENGSRITYPGRVGTVDLEGGAKEAFTRRLGGNVATKSAIGRHPFVPTPSVCKPPPIPKLPAIDVDKFCDKNGIQSTFTVYPNNIR